jgi:hypothetical protein
MDDDDVDRDALLALEELEDTDNEATENESRDNASESEQGSADQ